MTESVAQRDPVEQLAEEFMARLRRGERPAVSEYAASHPELADEIRDLFPALLVMQEVKPSGTEVHASDPGLEAPPEHLGEYRILREVARGGMGVVYEAEQVALGRHVALKVLPVRAGGDPLRLLRFRREARSAARLHHTNIVPVFDVGTADGLHYYAMQFIRGQGLDEVLRELHRLGSGAKPTAAPAADLTVSLAEGLRTGVFDAAAYVPVPKPAGPEPSSILSGPVSHYFRSVAGLGVQAAEALAYAHGQRVLHRDVKPSNLLLDRQGTLWLTDFGLAKDDGDDLTRTGDVVGTLRYMAPERFQGVSDPRSDVYALGVTLYELLTLRPAFPEADRVRLVRQIAQDDPPRPRVIDRGIPRDLETIVLKAIEKDPGRRYATAEEMGEDLKRFLADRPIKARRASRREQAWRWCRRNPGVAVSLALAFAFLASGVAVSAWQAVRARQAEGVAEDRLRNEIDANKEARFRLFEARRAEARASRFSGRPGQRLNSLAALAEASALAHELELGGDVLAGLRDEAVAALALPDLRPVKEWDGLPPGAAEGPWFTEGLAFDADLEHYARGDRQGNVSVRRVADDQEVAALPGPPGADAVSGILFSPDGGRLAVRYYRPVNRGGAYVRVWDWRPGRILFEPPGQGWGFAFSPDGRLLAVSGESLRLLDATTGRQVWKVDRLKGNGVQFHPNGEMLAVYEQGTMVFLRTESGVRTNLLSGYARNPQGPVWHPDGVLMIIVGEDFLFRHDTPDPHSNVNKYHGRLLGHRRGVNGCAFAPGSGLLLSWGGDGVCRLWDPYSQSQLLQFDGQDGWFSRDGRRLATRTGSRLVLWEVEAARGLRSVAGSWLLSSRECSVSPDGRWLAHTGGGGLRVSDLALGGEPSTLRFPGVGGARFHPGGRELYTAGPAGVKVWPVRQGDGVLRIGPPRDLADHNAGLSFDRGGRLLALGRKDDIRVLDLTDPSRVTPPIPWKGSAATIGETGRWVAAFTDDVRRGVRVWELATGASREVAPGASAQVAFGRDDEWLAVGTPGGYDVYRTGTWERVAHLPRRSHSAYPSPPAFSPDGAVLAVQTSPTVVTLFETATWRPVVRLESPYLEETDVAGFSPDGGRLLVFNQSGGEARFWDLRFLRERLRGLRLDWDPPDRTPAEAPPTPVRVEFDAGAAEPARWLRSGREHAAARRFNQAVADFTTALGVNPGLREARTGRGTAYASMGSWARAADDLPPPAGRGVVSDTGVQAACIQLLVGDGKGYAQTRTRAIAEVGAAEPSDSLFYDACRLCTLTAETGDAARVLEWAERALEPKPSPWRLHVLARAQLRAGKYADAVARAEESLTAGPGWPGRPLNWLLLAAAHHHLGHADEAAKWLARGADWLNRPTPREGEDLRPLCPPGLHLTDWLEFHVLFAEAERLLPKAARK